MKGIKIMMENGLSAADVAAVTRNDGYNNGGMFGGNNDWGWIIILLLFGWGRNGFGGFGGNTCGGSACATQADLAAGFANSTVLSSLDDIKLGQANAINYNNQGFAGLNTALLQGFHGVDNAICTLGYQQAQCCCDTRAAIKDVGTGVEKAGWNLSKQISDCCCDLEKMNLQNRFDAQAYNCNTLQAIDKVGDRIIDYLANEKAQALRDENQALRLAASQAKQNEYLVEKLNPNSCPVAAYVVPNPNCCYGNPYGVGYNNGCGCGNAF